MRGKLEKEWLKRSGAGSDAGGASASAAAGQQQPKMPLVKNENGTFVELETLRPILHHYDEAYGRHPQYHRVFGDGGFAAQEKRLKAGLHMPLMLAVLRSLFPGVPVRICGNAMIKRCLSLVAVDYSDPAQPPVPTLAITHAAVYQTGSGSGSDMAQQFLRPSTTVGFHAARGFDSVQVLATQDSWRVRPLCVALLCFPESSFTPLLRLLLLPSALPPSLLIGALNSVACAAARLC